MVTSIRILPEQADDLAAVCALGAATLQATRAAIENAELTIKRDRLRELIASKVDEEISATKLCRVVFGLSAIGSRNATTISDTIDGLTATLASEYKDDGRFANWSDVSPALLAILLCESVYLAAKAIDVAYDFERIMSDCRIITSIRPVYTDGRDRIVGNTIVQTLRLEFVTISGARASTSIALDYSDIMDLEKACADARLKAKVARDELERGKKREIKGRTGSPLTSPPLRCGIPTHIGAISNELDKDDNVGMH